MSSRRFPQPLRLEPHAVDGDGPASPPPPARGPGRGRRRIAALAAGAAVVATGATLAATGTLGAGSGSRRAGAALPAGETTAVVQRRTLADQLTVDGTLGYAGASDVYNRLSGTYTKLPAIGAVITRGHALFRVDDEPVILMYGSSPAYRALSTSSADGPDVRELERNLAALGYDPGTVDEHFDSATASAVESWQHSLGLTRTGSVELGRVVFAPGARRVTAVDVSLGATGAGGGGGGSATAAAGGAGTAGGASLTPAPSPAGRTELAAYTPGTPGAVAATVAAAAPASGAGSTARSATAKAGGKAAKQGGSSGSASSGGSATTSSSGGGGAAATRVLETTSTRQQVTVGLDADSQDAAYLGQGVDVQLPDGRSVRGHVTRVGRVATTSSSSGSAGGGGGSGASGATITVIVRLVRPVARLDQAPVSVTLTRSRRRHVLAVPATALVATAGGGYAVSALEGGRIVSVPVTPGLFASGYVEVSGPGLAEGMTVTVPQ